MFYKISGRAFEILEEKLFAFDTTIDILIYKNFAFYYDPKVINEEFGLDERTNKKIENKISKMAKQFKGLKKCKKYVESLSTVYKKKINNIDKYGIIDMKKEDLISIIQSDENLSGRISIKDGDFEINNEKDFKKFINLMCDDYLQSNITKTLYISDSKHLD